MHTYTIPLSSSIKRILMMFFDSIMIAVALAFSFSLLGQEFLEQEGILYFVIATLLSVLVLARQGLYRAIILYMGLQSGFLVLKGVTISTCFVAASYFLSEPFSNPDYSILPIYWMMALLFIGGSRFVAKVLLQSLIRNFRPREPIIICLLYTSPSPRDS